MANLNKQHVKAALELAKKDKLVLYPLQPCAISVKDLLEAALDSSEKTGKTTTTTAKKTAKKTVAKKSTSKKVAKPLKLKSTKKKAVNKKK